MNLERVDHIVIPVTDIERSIAYYEEVLGMELISHSDELATLCTEDQMVKLETASRKDALMASEVVPGSVDICFSTSVSVSLVVEHFESCGIPILAGPVEKVGSKGKMLSVYTRDPDGSLIEVSTYHELR